MKIFRLRHRGFSLLELILFMGIAGMMSLTLIAVFISTQDARVRQQGIAGVEQRGGQILQILTRRIRRAERVYYPPVGSSGSLLSLQMPENSEHPTVFTQQNRDMLLAEKNTISPFLNDRLKIWNLQFFNVDGANVIISFDLFTILQLPKPLPYKRHFEVAVTLFPHDLFYEGQCNATPSNTSPVCPIPTCVNHVYRWYYCHNIGGASGCAQSTDTVPC